MPAWKLFMLTSYINPIIHNDFLIDQIVKGVLSFQGFFPSGFILIIPMTAAP